MTLSQEDSQYQDFVNSVKDGFESIKARIAEVNDALSAKGEESKLTVVELEEVLKRLLELIVSPSDLQDEGLKSAIADSQSKVAEAFADFKTKVEAFNNRLKEKGKDFFIEPLDLTSLEEKLLGLPQMTHPNASDKTILGGVSTSPPITQDPHPLNGEVVVGQVDPGKMPETNTILPGGTILDPTISVNPPVTDVPTAPVVDVPTVPAADVPTAPVVDVPTVPETDPAPAPYNPTPG